MHTAYEHWKFQSTPPRGRRLYTPELLTWCSKYFNPRLREGGDRCISVNAERILNFNPRLREGGDDFTNDVAQRTQISIHASAREATQIFELGYHLSIHFNPRLREGGDARFLNNLYVNIAISIHASAREATEIRKKDHLDYSISIHASAREATVSKKR